MKQFIKSKSVGYFILAGIALFSLIFAIVFFVTFSNPGLDPIFHDNPMGNKAAGMHPETIGIFCLAGFVVEAALLVIPQYRFIHIAAVVMFGLALSKEIRIIPDFIAGKVNHVEYNGGNFNLNMFFLIALFLIVISAVVVAFFGFYKDEKQAQKEMSMKKDPVQIVRVASAGTCALAAVLVSILVVSSLGGTVASGFNPLTKEVKQMAKDYYYPYDPESVLIKEEETWDYTDSRLSGLEPGFTRKGDDPEDPEHFLVYYFEGAYAEGYQGDYSETYGYLYLWDDGIYVGRVNDTTFKGFWYNSSIASGEDANGNNIVDCLNMVSNANHYDSIITEQSGGFYEKQAYVYLGFSWGTRSMILNGYRYYPEVAISVDTTAGTTRFKAGEAFDRAPWVCNRILKNLNYSPVFKASEVNWSWELEEGEESPVDKEGKFKEQGNYRMKASWGNFETFIDVKVGKADAQEEAEEEPQA